MSKTKTDNLPPIARRLRVIIRRKGLSQADVAFAAGMSQANLSELLRGVRRDVMLSTVEKIVKAAGGDDGRVVRQ